MSAFVLDSRRRLSRALVDSNMNGGSVNAVAERHAVDAVELAMAIANSRNGQAVAGHLSSGNYPIHDTGRHTGAKPGAAWFKTKPRPVARPHDTDVFWS